MLCDCHMHAVLDSVYWRDALRRHENTPHIPFIRNMLENYRSAGFTYLRDGGDRWGVGAAARKLAPEYGITYRTPLAPLCLRGHYGSFIGETYETSLEYAALVKKHRQSGADFIKIMISGLMNFNQFGVLTEEGLPPALIKELIHIAHEEGMAVMAHANGGDAVLTAAAAGIDSVEHGAYLHADALAAMAENRVIWVPTLSTVGNLRGKGRFDETAVCRILESALQNVREFADLGGLLAPGTDAGAWAVPHGTLSEYDLLREALGEQVDDILHRGITTLIRKF